MCSPRAFGLYIAAIILPPAAVLIATDSFGAHFWINFLLTILAWIPGVFHAWWVVATKDDEARAALHCLQAETAPYRGAAPYERLPATMPPSSSKAYEEYATAPPPPSSPV